MGSAKFADPILFFLLTPLSPQEMRPYCTPLVISLCQRRSTTDSQTVRARITNTTIGTPISGGNPNWKAQIATTPNSISAPSRLYRRIFSGRIRRLNSGSSYIPTARLCLTCLPNRTMYLNEKKAVRASAAIHATNVSRSIHDTCICPSNHWHFTIRRLTGVSRSLLTALGT